MNHIFQNIGIMIYNIFHWPFCYIIQQFKLIAVFSKPATCLGEHWVHSWLWRAVMLPVYPHFSKFLETIRPVFLELFSKSLQKQQTFHLINKKWFFSLHDHVGRPSRLILNQYDVANDILDSKWNSHKKCAIENVCNWPWSVCPKPPCCSKFSRNPFL